MEQKVYKYNLETTIIFDGDKNTSRSFKVDSRNIVNFSVSNNYINDLFPIAFLQLSMSERDYYFILENKNTVKILMTVTSYLVGDSSTLEEYLSEKIPYAKNKIIEKLFRPYFDDVSPFSERKLYEEDIMEDDKSEFKVMSMYLFAEDSLEKNKTDINFVMNNATIFDSLVYICNLSGVNHLLIKEPDNTEVYKQIICPPLKLKSSINFMQKHYGIYSEGVMLYQDFNRTYLIPKYFKKAIVEPNEFDKIFIFMNEVSGENSNMNITSYFDSKHNAYIINTFNNPQIIDNSNFDKEIVGDKLNIIDVSEVSNNTESIELGLNAYQSDNKVEKSKNVVCYNKNKYPIEEYYIETINKQIVMNINLLNIDISFIAPNKEIVLMFENAQIEKKYGGLYSLRSFVYSIKRDLGGAVDFQLSCQIVLNKVMY